MATEPIPSVPGPPTLTRQGQRATLMLNRPEQHNRLQVDDLLALQRHFAALQADTELQLLVLAARGKSFCSGFDLGALAAGTGQPSNAGPRLFEQTVDMLEALPMATVCRMQGSVYGGATDLALACDWRIGVHGMLLRMPAVRLGLHYYPSGLRRFVSRLGLATAKRLFLLAEDLEAEQLLALRYLDRLVAGDALDAAVEQFASALDMAAPLALRGMKASLNEIACGDFDLTRLHEREALCASSLDLAEGQAALAARRQAVFKGC